MSCAGLQVEHALDFALHAVEILHQLGNFILVFILDFEQYDVTDRDDSFSFSISLSISSRM